MTIRKLDRDSAPDWFEFFDNRAFADHHDWKGCYCTAPFMPRLADFPNRTKRRRDYAAWLIDTGRMIGYLAYEDDRVVGWCNVNLRAAVPMYATASDNAGRVLSIACFTVEKQYRRRGIASRLLRRAVEDAAEAGFEVIEAYPRRRAATEFGQFLGPKVMYEREGFVDEVADGRSVMRKYLNRQPEVP